MIADRLYVPHETIVSPIILMGPTTTGKSSIAQHLARMAGAEIVNADRMYTFAGPVFNLGLRLEPGELDDGVGRHLYGAMTPHQDPLAPESYMQQAVSAIDEISKRGVPAVIDGCTRRYNEALYDHYGPKHCVRITWEDPSGLPERVGRRMEGLIRLGLYAETEKAIDAGHELTFPMTSILYTLARGVYHDPRNEDRLKEEAKAECLDVALRHDHWYASNTDAQGVFGTASGNRRAIAEDIMELMTVGGRKV